jgi:hypothetical protein
MQLWYSMVHEYSTFAIIMVQFNGFARASSVRSDAEYQESVNGVTDGYYYCM